jgi:hypothetical protein
VHQAEIARVFQADGPFTSMYMDTEGDVEQAADRVAVRWKTLRGALLAAAQAAVPHVAVLTDRTGADMAARVADDVARTERVTGRVTPHIHKPHAGGWSEPRFQHRAEAIWESNASEVADALTRLVDQVRPRFVAVAGDVRALQLLHEQAPKRVRELLEVVGGEYGSLEAVFAEADKLVAATVRADNRALLDRFAEELGQRDRAADGAAATRAALGTGAGVRVLDPAAGPGQAPAGVSAPYCASRSGRRPSPGRGVGAGPRRAAAAGSA